MVEEPLAIKGESRSLPKQELRQLLERAHRVEDEIREAMALRRDFWSDVKGRGYDVAAMKLILREQRQNQEKLSELRAVTEFYREVLGDGPLFDRADADPGGTVVEMTVLEMPGAAARRAPEEGTGAGPAARDQDLEQRRALGREATRRWREKKKAEKRAAQEAAE